MINNYSNEKLVLFLFHDTGKTGASISLLNIISSISRNNNCKILVHVNTNSGYVVNFLQQLDIDVYYHQKFTKNKSKFLKLLVRIKYIIQFIYFLFKIKPDIVYINTITNFIESLIVYIFKIPTIMHVHEAFLMINKMKKAVKLYKYIVREFIFVSKYSYESFIFQSGLINNYQIIPNGVKCKEQFKIKMEKLADKVINLSVIGTIDRNKSQLTAVYTLYKLIKNNKYNFHLNFYGSIIDLEYYDDILKTINNFGMVQNVTFFFDKIPQEEIYNKSDIVLVTSKDESFSMIVIESFSYKIPVISSLNGGANELIEDNINGFLYRYNDVNTLCSIILKIISEDVDINKIIDVAKKNASEKYNIVLIAQRIFSIIKKLS